LPSPTERSAPHDPGAALDRSEDGEVIGSVSGGCVEASVMTEATEALRTSIPKRVTFGIAEDEAFSVGLTCGGTIHRFVERGRLGAPPSS
jgi:xanthine dehydrogenase accessory factor